MTLKTIAVTPATKARLDAAKLVPTESYESVLTRLLARPSRRKT